MSFIKENDIEGMLSLSADSSRIDSIISKSLEHKGLSQEEAAMLLNVTDAKLLEKMFSAARKIKEAIYGKRLVFFAPLYLTNSCINDCLYCGFRASNKGLKRKVLNPAEIREETLALIKEGQKRLLLVAGEHPVSSNIDYLENAIKTVYNTKHKNGEIRRVNVNVAPLSVADFKRLKEAGIGTYQLFQETYHPGTYGKMHPSGPKSDYEYRLYGMDRAQEAGIDDVGVGALFGLHDFRFEVLALLAHASHLEEKFGTGPHTISVPRLEPAEGAPLASNPPHPVSDADFKKMVAVLRMAVPYTGMILTTREKPPYRDEIFKVGISQISAGSRTNPGGYASAEKELEQFAVSDHRTLPQTVSDILDEGFYPSFCTACYRLGRTGEDFMRLAKPGAIRNFCTPNCILTFKEYLLDYASPELRKKGEKIIEKELLEIGDTERRELTKKKLAELEAGKRDLYF
ncbi:3-methylornithine synthase [uncultured archaeon]|nr:3-methylornithine synthase [uncultured archaeon]